VGFIVFLSGLFKKIKGEFFTTTLVIGHMESYQCIVHAHDKQALKTTASKMLNSRL